MKLLITQFKICEYINNNRFSQKASHPVVGEQEHLGVDSSSEDEKHFGESGDL